MDEELKGLIERFAKATAADLASFKAALIRLEENQRAEHAKMVEMAATINGHTQLLEQYRTTWTANFTELGKLVNSQTQIIEAMKNMLLPPAVN